MSTGQGSLITTTPDTQDAHRAMCSELQENMRRVLLLPSCWFQLHTCRLRRQRVYLFESMFKKRKAMHWCDGGGKTSPDMSEYHWGTTPRWTSIYIWGISTTYFMQSDTLKATVLYFLIPLLLQATLYSYLSYYRSMSQKHQCILIIPAL